jgi:hypothetical protein
MSSGGKGDKSRPYSVDRKTFENNWDAIFGDKQKNKEESETIDNETEQRDSSSVHKEMGS